MNRTIRRRKESFIKEGILSLVCMALLLFIIGAASGDNSLTSSSNATEVSPLAGKKICIDPGHGGRETGAVGVGGLKESDVNLRVSHFLREMLEKEGAVVLMTRTTDTAISLMARCELNKKHEADLFVSVHHNANAQVDRSSNRTEVFYHWHDRGGPSEDAARHVYRELQSFVNLPDSKAYMCWAYGVLRENRYPAILGEMSYLSNPEEEKRLREEEYLRKEAGAYFRGIKAFFTGGRPEISLSDNAIDQARRIVSALIKQPKGSALIDPQRFTVELNGEPLDTYFYDRSSGQLFVYYPPIDQNEEMLEIAARNLAGHNSFVERVDLAEQGGPKPIDVEDMEQMIQIQVMKKAREKAGAAPIRGAKIFSDDTESPIHITNISGTAIVMLEEQKPASFIVKSNGYWTQRSAMSEAPSEAIRKHPVTLDPMFEGVLHSKVIIVDPEGGGDDPHVIGATGLRASDANLRTALYLEDYLRQAGADVSLTRRIDRSMDNVSRVRFGLERNPAVFISIGHRLPEPGLKEKPGMNVTRIGHRWSGGGEVGKALIFHLRELLGTGAELGDVTSREPLPSEIHNWSSWEVMHAAQDYTALYVCPVMFDAPGAEVRISTTAGCRKEALAIFYGLLQYFGLDDRNLASIEGNISNAKTGIRVHNALVWLNDTLVTQTESDGKFLFKFIDGGTHTIKVMCEGYAPVERKVETEKGKRLTVQINI